MSRTDNIFLVGPMGVGKSTIGKKLAKKLGMRFIDSDREIEKRTGAAIPLIFDVEGEQGFRDRESRLIDDLSQECGIVLATGGGAVLARANRDILAERGFVVYLCGSPELLMKRTAHDHSRPLLETTDRLGKIRLLLKERQSYYDEVADMTLVVDKLSVRQIIDRISDFIKEI